MFIDFRDRSVKNMFQTSWLKKQRNHRKKKEHNITIHNITIGTIGTIGTIYGLLMSHGIYRQLNPWISWAENWVGISWVYLSWPFEEWWSMIKKWGKSRKIQGYFRFSANFSISDFQPKPVMTFQCVFDFPSFWWRPNFNSHDLNINIWGYFHTLQPLKRHTVVYLSLCLSA